METRLCSGANRTLLLLAIVLCVGLFPIPRDVSAGQGPLDGKVFIVENGSKGGKAGGRDVYLFSNGTFRSTIRDKWDGFREGAYTSTNNEDNNEDAITFAADTKSGSRGTIRWEGTVRGGEIDVRYTWADAPKWYSRDPKREYWARGKEVKSPAGASVRGTGTSALLDGQTFFVRTGEKGKPADHDDYMIFRDGMFVSSGCVEQDFGKSPYSAAAEGNGIRFRAETRSSTHGTMYWGGIVRGDVMEATARWVHDRWYWKIDRQYWYRGGPAE